MSKSHDNRSRASAESHSRPPRVSRRERPDFSTPSEGTRRPITNAGLLDLHEHIAQRDPIQLADDLQTMLDAPPLLWELLAHRWRLTLAQLQRYLRGEVAA